MLQRPRGTRDFLPDEMEARSEIEGRMREAARRFGYRQVRTPAFEELELFTLRSGPGIVNEMYAFEDKGGRGLALRPELTAPVLRLYVNEARVLPKPLRWYYIDDCFRYERPQKGRYRQFWQFGAELIGVDSAGADAEVILLADAALRAAGVEYELKVGHLALLRSLLADLDEGAKRTVMGLLDKREMDALADALTDLGRADLLGALEALVGATTLDEAFAVTGPLPEEARLRELVALLDAAGLDVLAQLRDRARSRLLHGHGLRGLRREPRGREPDRRRRRVPARPPLRRRGHPVLRLRHRLRPGAGRARRGRGAAPDRGRNPLDTGGRGERVPAAAAFRAAGLRAELDLSGKGLGAQMTRAAKTADFAVLIGAREAEAGVVAFKDLSTGLQETLALEEAVARAAGREVDAPGAR